jgi:hypothetical protein
MDVLLLGALLRGHVFTDPLTSIGYTRNNIKHDNETFSEGLRNDVYMSAKA